MPTLTTYVNETRRLLHDANATFWSTAELTDYINDGRKNTALDTGCLRSLETVSLTAATETFNLTSFTSKGDRAVDILNLIVVWGQMRIPMMWASWTDFSARWRVWVTNRSRPAVWSRYGNSLGVIYIQPVPDTTYVGYADIVYIPVDLVDDNTADELVFPSSKPVAYYAAYKAKLKEQSYGESEIFHRQYKEKCVEAINTVFTRRLPNAYT